MTRDELVAALAEARDLPDGVDKITELERLAAYADAAADLRLGFDARLELIATHQHTQRWRMLAPFEWCRATYDHAPALFDSRQARLLHRYHRWTVAMLLGTYRVGLTQTRAGLDDLARRLSEDGHSPQLTHKLRCRIADHLGDEPTARGWLTRWRTAPRDEQSDCAGCDRSEQAGLLAGWGEWAEAASIVEPVLTDPAGCAQQPEQGLAGLLLPYLRLGRYQEAAQAHIRAYRRHRHERDAFPLLAAHLRFCALTGHHERGLRILAEQLGRLDRPSDELSAMEFAAAGALVCRLAVEAGHAGRTLHRPGYGDRRAAELTVPSLGADLLATTQDLAGRFDARNGTSHQSGRMASWLADQPLPGRGVRSVGGRPGPLPADEQFALPVEEPADDWAVPVGVPPDSRPELLAPLRLAAVVAVLDERRDHYVIEADGTIRGRWGDALIRFERMGDGGEILYTRVTAERRLPTRRLAEAYEFCNTWNRDRLLPKAYVRESGSGELILAGEVSTDLRQGVAGPQLAVLVNAALTTGVAFAAAVAALP